MYGQMNEPPGARARVALTGLTVAEYFRDQEGQDVLLFIDNIFRFTQAGSEVSVWKSKPVFCSWSEIVLLIRIYFCFHRCLPCWAVSPLLWVISQLWPLTWVPCRKESPQPRRVQSHLCRYASFCLPSTHRFLDLFMFYNIIVSHRPSMCLLMT